ncbi:helix-turn-helix domain-containing protein [Sphingobacterium zeae]|uniref:helix-turn-helix domain-containing protein n=1 Tax=Sphingobacterium zeae TaxID=1776859 RepID=UPI003605CA79
MKSQIVKNMLVNMPEDIKLFSRIYANLVLRINNALDEQGLTKSELANRMEKRPSEISKWLNGDHNFTLKSLCKLQVELGINLIEIASENKIHTPSIKVDKAEKKVTQDNIIINIWEENRRAVNNCKVLELAKHTEFSNNYQSYGQ